MPVVFGEHHVTNACRRILQDGKKTSPLDALRSLHSRQFEAGDTQVDDADQALRHRRGLYHPWKMHDPRSLYTAVVKARFATWKRTTVVGGNDNHGVVEYALLLQFGSDETNVVIVTADFMIVLREILAGPFGIDEVRRHDHIIVAVDWSIFIDLPVPVERRWQQTRRKTACHADDPERAPPSPLPCPDRRPP